MNRDGQDQAGDGQEAPEGAGLPGARLDALIKEATVDANGESEQATGFYTMLEEHLAVPFKTEVLGVEVTVERIELTDEERIVAVCARGKSRQRISIADLPLPDPAPEGSEWIDAYPSLGAVEVGRAVARQAIDIDWDREAHRPGGPPGTRRMT